MIREAIVRISTGTDLTSAEAGRVMEEIMRGAATPAQVGGFLTALRMKGESETEIAAFARTMRASPEIRSQRTGFFLWGIDEEPFCPLVNGSSTSRTSVRWRWRISRANFSRDVATRARADMTSA